MEERKSDNKTLEQELKKLKPLEIKINEIKSPVKEVKTEKKKEDKKPEEKKPEKKEEKLGEVEEKKEENSQFSEKILSEESKKVAIPIIRGDNLVEIDKADNLERFAETVPLSTANSSNSNTGYVSSSNSYAGNSSSYMNSPSDQNNNQNDYAPNGAAFNFGMNDRVENRRNFESHGFIGSDQSSRGRERMTESNEKRELEEFSRSQQYRVSRANDERPKRRV